MKVEIFEVTLGGTFSVIIKTAISGENIEDNGFPTREILNGYMDNIKAAIEREFTGTAVSSFKTQDILVKKQ